MSVGTWYYPKTWPRERWETDIARIADAGLETLRIGVFHWSRIEPERGEFSLEYLHDALDIAAAHDLEVMLGTPTGAPPKWLVDEHPEILQEEADGTVRAFGSRRHYCFNSQQYRAETKRIVERLSEAFADRDVVMGWQLDNEYGQKGTHECFCEDCGRAFRAWLRERYGDIETLNEAWGTGFWSQTVTSFETIDPPRHTAATKHPSKLLDYSRFCSDSIVEYNRLQADIVESANPEWVLTTNFVSWTDSLDTRAIGEDLDFASWDSYPLGGADHGIPDPTPAQLRAGDPDTTSLNHDLLRNSAAGPFWVMEQQPGDINWADHNPQPAEGAIGLWAMLASAHGAETVNYFRYRKTREGQEQYHAGLVRHDGSPDRGLEEASDAASQLSELPALDSPDASVALIHDYDDQWALDIQPHSSEFDYLGHLGTYYSALRARSVTVDIVGRAATLDEYDAVIAPTVYLVGDGITDALEAYASDGGELLVTMRSGVKDRANKRLNELAPGPLAELAGVRVERHESLREELPTQLRYDAGSRPNTELGDAPEYDYQIWADWLSTESAAVVGEYSAGPATETPAITHNPVGAGHVAYVGVWPGEALADALVCDLLDRSGVEYTDRLPDGIRFAERDGHTWVLNFTGESVHLTAPGGSQWLLGTEPLDAFDCAVIDCLPPELSVA